MMRRSTAALVAALLATGLARSAEAAAVRRGPPSCGTCGPEAAEVRSRTIRPMRSLARYHDVTVATHVRLLRRVVTVTRIQPIFRIHDITRIHHRTMVASDAFGRRDPWGLSPVADGGVYECGCRP